MRCWNVRTRLVALQDDELSPGEARQVSEHLARCADCRQLERRLANVTPQARLVVPPDVRARLHARVDGPVVRAIAERRPAEAPPSPWTRVLAWLQRDAEISMGAVLGYALLAMFVGWSLGTLDHAETHRARLATHGDLAEPLAPTPSAEPIPVEQYRPAAWTPAEDGPYH